MNTIPVTPEDFARIGRQHQTSDILGAMNRLVPLGTADLAELAMAEFDQTDLDEIKGYGAQLSGEGVDVQKARNGKKAARVNEAGGIRNAKLLLRRSIAVAANAIRYRPAPPGESDATTKEIVSGLMTQVDSLSGRIGANTVKLAGRLGTVKTVLAAPEIAPVAAKVPARAALLAAIDAAIAALPTLSQLKKGGQQAAKQGTVDLDEIDGRAYMKLKHLAEIGAAHFAVDNPKRAAEYRLTETHAANAPAPPAPPAPPPVQP